MKLRDWTSAERGRTADLAKRIGVLPVLVSQWAAGRQIPHQHCPAVERESGGAVMCEHQRPDLTWHRIPDPAWPWHPQGRPLLDLTRAHTAAPATAA